MPIRCRAADRVGAGVADLALGVEADDAVADPGGLLGHEGVAGERERPVVHHAGEPVEELEVDTLQLAGAAAGHGGGVPGDEGDDLVPEADGDGLYVGPFRGAADDGGVAHADVAQPPHLGGQGPFHLVDDGAEHVVAVQGLVGGGPHLGQHHEPVALVAGHGRQQQQVGEAEVGEDPPRGGQPVEVGELLRRQAGVGTGQLEQGRHGRSGALERVGAPLPAVEGHQLAVPGAGQEVHGVR